MSGRAAAQVLAGAGMVALGAVAAASASRGREYAARTGTARSAGLVAELLPHPWDGTGVGVPPAAAVDDPPASAGVGVAPAGPAVPAPRSAGRQETQPV